MVGTKTKTISWQRMGQVVPAHWRCHRRRDREGWRRPASPGHRSGGTGRRCPAGNGRLHAPSANRARWRSHQKRRPNTAPHPGKASDRAVPAAPTLRRGSARTRGPRSCRRRESSAWSRASTWVRNPTRQPTRTGRRATALEAGSYANRERIDKKIRVVDDVVGVLEMQAHGLARITRDRGVCEVEPGIRRIRVTE